MIDYFMVPFPAPSDAEAMAGIATAVNDINTNGAIQNAPHHFELYLLGELDEHGTIFPKKELVCDCSALVRPRRQSAESDRDASASLTRSLGARASGSGSNSMSSGENVPKST